MFKSLYWDRMKRTVLFVCLLLTSVVQASWQDNWSNAVEFCHNKDYVNAENSFNLAITELEAKEDVTHPHVYVDRARLFSLLNRDIEALRDVNVARASALLIGEDLLRAVVTRLCSYYRLNMTEEIESELKVLRSLSSIPKVEVYETKIIVRNIPDCECSKKMIKAYIASVFCESEDDVKFMNGILIGKRKPCDCSKEVPEKKDLLINSSAATETSINNCKWYCGKLQFSGNAFCMATFRGYKCQLLCLIAVEAIKDGCNWCCESGNFYGKCIKPFSDILAHMDPGCDPDWD